MIKKKIILITGSDGFIGSHLVNFFDKKNNIVIATYYKRNILKKKSRNVIYKYCDVRIRSQVSTILKKFKPNEIFHLAAKSMPSFSFKYPIETFNTNVIGTLNILEECRQLGLKSRILIACSSGQYGSRKLKNLPLTENHLSNPEHLYGLSKSFQNQIGFQYVFYEYLWSNYI
jgi:GDP-4-dehydro-6-deoxy-D-mannose reductase